MRKVSYKLYKCRRCGFEKKIKTNHFGSVWSFGRYNTCPECPPFAKYPEYGGQTYWDCQEDENGIILNLN
jgi:DNA-directed RNA polymerase subunit RPC12/RpoP